MPKLQNFAVPANDDAVIDVDVLTEISGQSLDGATIEWAAYEQLHGVVQSATPVIFKTSESPGGGITLLPSPSMMFNIALAAHDTAALLGNYYHEATVIGGGERNTVMYGAMCVTETVNP